MKTNVLNELNSTVGLLKDIVMLVDGGSYTEDYFLH